MWTMTAFPNVTCANQRLGCLATSSDRSTVCIALSWGTWGPVLINHDFNKIWSINDIFFVGIAEYI
jgi:hypothetical protein